MMTSQNARKRRTFSTRLSRCQTVASRRARKSPYVRSTSAHLTAVNRFVTKFFGNAQKLIVLGNAVGPAKRTRFDLAGVGRNRDVGNRCVFGFAGAMTDHGG